MEVIILVILKIIFFMVKENIFLILDQFMKVIIIMGKKMGKVYIIKIMELSILVIFMKEKFTVVV